MWLQTLLLQGQGYGEDVESVENLIRRHEEMEREVRVIQERSTVSIPKASGILTDARCLMSYQQDCFVSQDTLAYY